MTVGVQDKNGSSGTNGGSALASLTYSQTVSAGSNRILCVSVQTRGTVGAPSISGITFGGVALSQAIGVTSSTSGGSNADVWYLIAPAVSTANIQISFSSVVSAVAESCVLTNAVQAAPEATNTSNNAGNGLTVTTVTASAMLVDSISSASLASLTASGTNQTIITASVTVGTGSTQLTGASSTLPATTVGTYTVNYSGSTSNPRAHAVAAFANLPAPTLKTISKTVTCTAARSNKPLKNATATSSNGTTRVNKPLKNVTATSIAALALSTIKALKRTKSVAVVGLPNIIRNYSFTRLVSSTASATISKLRTLKQALTSSSTVAVAHINKVLKSIVASSTVAAAHINKVLKNVVASSTIASTIIKCRTILKSLTTTQGITATKGVSVVGKNVTSTSIVVALESRLIALTIAAISIIESVSIYGKQFIHAVTVSASSATTVTAINSYVRSLLANASNATNNSMAFSLKRVATSVVSVVDKRSITKQILATVTNVANAFKRQPKTLTSVASNDVTILRALANIRRQLNAVSTSSATLKRSLARNIKTSATNAVRIAKNFAKILIAQCTPTVDSAMSTGRAIYLICTSAISPILKFSTTKVLAVANLATARAIKAMPLDLFVVIVSLPMALRRIPVALSSALGSIAGLGKSIRRKFIASAPTILRFSKLPNKIIKYVSVSHAMFAASTVKQLFAGSSGLTFINKSIKATKTATAASLAKSIRQIRFNFAVAAMVSADRKNLLPKSFISTASSTTNLSALRGHKLLVVSNVVFTFVKRVFGFAKSNKLRTIVVKPRIRTIKVRK